MTQEPNGHPSPTNPRRLVTVAEAAWLLQARPEHVRAMIRDGRLPARQSSRRWRIEPDALRPILMSLDARLALRSLEAGEISAPPCPRDTRPRPLSEAIPVNGVRS